MTFMLWACAHRKKTSVVGSRMLTLMRSAKPWTSLSRDSMLVRLAHSVSRPSAELQALRWWLKRILMPVHLPSPSLSTVKTPSSRLMCHQWPLKSVTESIRLQSTDILQETKSLHTLAIKASIKAKKNQEEKRKREVKQNRKVLMIIQTTKLTQSQSKDTDSQLLESTMLTKEVTTLSELLDKETVLLVSRRTELQIATQDIFLSPSLLLKLSHTSFPMTTQPFQLTTRPSQLTTRPFQSTTRPFQSTTLQLTQVTPQEEDFKHSSPQSHCNSVHSSSSTEEPISLKLLPLFLLWTTSFTEILTI